MLFVGNKWLASALIIITSFPNYCFGEEEETSCMCGDWEKWTEFGPCSAHCGGGTKSRSRSRHCSDYKVQIGHSKPDICLKNITQYQVCNIQDCGCENICSSWGDWNEGVCSLKCGGGIVTAKRSRQCQGSLGCLEEQQSTRVCNESPCIGCSCNPWSEWSEYGPCSATCGNGVQRRNRTRECFPKYQCEDALIEHGVTHCNLGVCCEDACTVWSQWKELSCSSTCDFGVGTRSRSRICALTSCNDKEEGIGSCKRHTCQETCDTICTTWGSWTTYPCTKSCGGGTRIRKRTRTCVFADCLEDDIRSTICNNFKCLECDDIHVCTSWSNWRTGPCSRSCDVGTRNRTRIRSCSVPECEVEDSQEEVCKQETCTETCDRDCNAWSVWFEGVCSQTCDEGIKVLTRNRSCPYGDCKKIDNTSLKCLDKICPVTCSTRFCSLWSGWESSNCSVSCGGGKLNWIRRRKCDNPDCPETETTTSPCNTHDCKKRCDLMCSQWSDWLYGDCSASCDVGVRQKSRSRECSSTECNGTDRSVENCQNKVCPETCDTLCSNWTISEHGYCSARCENGYRLATYKRSCPNYGCATLKNLTRSCNDTICPDICDTNCSIWSEWKEHGFCSVTCGNGTMHMKRNRTCTMAADCREQDEMFAHCSNICTESSDIKRITDLCQQGSASYHPYPTDCTKFIQCSNMNGIIMQCPDKTAWNTNIQACDHKWKISDCT